MDRVNIQTRQPISLFEIRQAHPHVSIPDGIDLTDLGYPWLQPVDAPTPLPGHRVELDAPEESDGIWRQDWVQVPLSVEEQAIALEYAQQTLVNRIKIERDRREQIGFLYLGQTLDSDPRSVQRITAAALAAQAALAAGGPFQIDWTTADNGTLTLDAAGMIGMPVALAQHAAMLHAHARELKVSIAAAPDLNTLNEIAATLQEGWPQ